MTTKKIKFVIDSDFKNTSLAGMAVSHLCKMIPVTDEDADKIELCVIEAVNNCIEHAYNRKPGYEIEIITTFYPEKIEIKVCDTGNPMDPLYLVNADTMINIPVPLSVEDIPENGRGLFLIKTYMDSVSYTLKNNKNCLIMTKGVQP